MKKKTRKYTKSKAWIASRLKRYGKVTIPAGKGKTVVKSKATVSKPIYDARCSDCDYRKELAMVRMDYLRMIGKYESPKPSLWDRFKAWLNEAPDKEYLNEKPLQKKPLLETIEYKCDCKGLGHAHPH